jgi:ethanolamine permease
MSAGDKRKGVASYERVDSDYLATRKLRKSAGWVLLWALGVGAVISGDFFGWNYGLAQGGVLGLAIATMTMAVMYVCMVLSIAELSAALPHAGGFYSFVRNALGPTTGYLCGVTDTIEYVLTPAAIVVSIGSYMNALVPDVRVEWWWVVSYAIFVAVNIRGATLTLKLGLAVTLLAIGVLVFFYASAIVTGEFQWRKLWNIAASPGHSPRWLPFGWLGVFAALPFGTWFYLAIEQLPLAAEETHDVVKHMPRALILGIATLLALSLFTLVINSGVGGGADALKGSAKPLDDGFKAVLGAGATQKLLTLTAVTGLVASFHTIIYAYGRVLFALSRAGYFPRWISVTSPWHTPHRALVLGAVAGLACALMIRVLGDQSIVGVALLNMSVAGAVVSYCLVLVSFIVLRVRKPDLPRPYRSPLGVPGAAVGVVLAVVVLAACFYVRDYLIAMLGVVAFVAIATLYFLLYSRKRLVAQAPEEEAALVARAEAELAHK